MLDERFFREELPRLIQEYQQQHGGETCETEVLLQHGISFRPVGPIEVGPAYIHFEYEVRGTRRQAVVPLDAILAVSLGPEEKKAKPGLV